jgi:hypothetical protein
MSNILKATHQGTLDLNGNLVSCAVLETGQRVISERSVSNALGAQGSGGYWKRRKEGAVLPRYLYAKFLEPFVSTDLITKLSQPIDYIALNKQKAKGIEAELLPEICNIWITANEKGAVPKSSAAFAKNAYKLLMGFATVGIIALVDEATGYQQTRQRDALQKILDKYLLKEYAAWAKRFPLEFYQEMFRLKGWNLDARTMKMPGVVGKYTNDIVYDRLAPGILTELKRINPKVDGKRKSKHHQWLTEDIGHPALNIHLNSVMALMRANTSWDKFMRGLARAYPKIGSPIALRFPDDED